MTKNKKHIHSSCLLLASVLSVVLYCICMHSYGEGILSPVKYLIRMAIAAISALPLAIYLPKQGKKNPKIIAGLFFALAIVSLNDYLGMAYMSYSIEISVMAIWPLLCYFASERLGRGIKAIALYNVFVVIVMYLTYGIWYTHSVFASDTVAQGYMFVIAQIIYAMVAFRSTKPALAEIVTALSFAVAVIFVWIMCNSRIQEIILSTDFRYDASDKAGELLNWFSHRSKMLAASISGNMSAVGDMYHRSLVSGCALNYFAATTDSLLPIACAFAVFAANGFLIWAAKSQKDNLLLGSLTAALTLKNLIAVGTNLFIVHSTSVGFVLINSAYDIAVVMFAVAAIYKKQTEVKPEE